MNQSPALTDNLLPRAKLHVCR